MPKKENVYDNVLKKMKDKENNINDNMNNEINDNINDELMEVDYSDLFGKKKTEKKILVNFTFKESTYKRLITLAEKSGRPLTEVVEMSLDRMLDSYKVKISEKAVEDFKARNIKKGRPRKENK